MTKGKKMRKFVIVGCGLILIIVTVVVVMLREKENRENMESVNIWIMGDSIASGGDRHSDSVGWGNLMQQYFKGDVIVRNAAMSGASSKSYKEHSIYDMNMTSLKDGDYVIIQFGHNDALMEDRSTNPHQSSSVEGSFKNILLEDYIKPIIEKGAYPILATSVVACAYDVEGRLIEMPYSAHAEAMRELVEECKEKELEVYLIDTYNITKELYQKIGETEANKLHNGWTHHNAYGAAYTAGVIVWEMKAAGIECCQDIFTFDDIIELSEDLQRQIEQVGAIDGL